MPICDFCSSPAVVKSYACESFQAFQLSHPQKGDLIGTSEGHWAACQVCADLIDHNCWEALLTRSYETISVKPNGPAEKEILMGFIRGLHNEFRARRLRSN